MDTLVAERGYLSPAGETQSMRRPTLVAIYSNNTVVEASLPYIRPVFVPHYVRFSKDKDVEDTVYMIEGHGRGLIPSVDKASRVEDKDDRDCGEEPPDTAATAPAPAKTQSVDYQSVVHNLQISHPAPLRGETPKWREIANHFDCSRKVPGLAGPLVRDIVAVGLEMDLAGHECRPIGERFGYTGHSAQTFGSTIRAHAVITDRIWKLILERRPTASLSFTYRLARHLANVVAENRYVAAEKFLEKFDRT